MGKLANDRIEAYVGQSLFVEKLREQTGFQAIEKLAPSIARKNYFLVFSDDYHATPGDTVNKLWKLIPEFKNRHGEALKKIPGTTGQDHCQLLSRRPTMHFQLIATSMLLLGSA